MTSWRVTTWLIFGWTGLAAGLLALWWSGDWSEDVEARHNLITFVVMLAGVGTWWLVGMVPLVLARIVSSALRGRRSGEPGLSTTAIPDWSAVPRAGETARDDLGPLGPPPPA